MVDCRRSLAVALGRLFRLRVGFHYFAGPVSRTPACAWWISATPERMGGWAIRAGDLLLGDQHGVLARPGRSRPASPKRSRRFHERGFFRGLLLKKRLEA